jgi:hypothetical protein
MDVRGGCVSCKNDFSCDVGDEMDFLVMAGDTTRTLQERILLDLQGGND